MEEYRLLLVVTIWVLAVGSVRTAAAAAALAPSFLLRGSQRESRECFRESQNSGPAPSVTGSVTLDKPPNLSEPHIPRLVKMRTVPTSQGWCED